jgi:hypothetical protein
LTSDEIPDYLDYYKTYNRLSTKSKNRKIRPILSESGIGLSLVEFSIYFEESASLIKNELRESFEN